MSYIKAKYNNLVRPYMRIEKQGFGSLYGGNQVSDVSNSERLDNIVNSSTGNMFVGNRLFSYTNLNTGQQLVFTNDSVFIVDNSTSSITEIDTQVALQFINESDWVKDVETTEPEPENLLINGDFEDGANGWTVSSNATWTVGNGKATYLNTNNKKLQQDFDFEDGKDYRLIIGIIDDFTVSYALDIEIGGTFLQVNTQLNATTLSYDFTADSQARRIRIRGFVEGTGFSIDNLSLIEL